MHLVVVHSLHESVLI